MAKIIDRVTLNLDRDDVRGWEYIKSAITILNYVKMNLDGSSPPAIEVVKKGDIYELVCGSRCWFDTDEDYNYGGHRRSIASYISGSELDAFVLDKHRYVSFAKVKKFIPVTQIRLFNHEDKRIRDFLREAPEDVFSRFVASFDYESFSDGACFSRIVGMEDHTRR